MSLKDVFKQQSKGMEALATTGVIGMHMVSGPLVGFAIGYGLDSWLGTGPWLKLVFLVLGIIAGFKNVYEDTQALLRKMAREDERRRAEALAAVPAGGTQKAKPAVPDRIATACAAETAAISRKDAGKAPAAHLRNGTDQDGRQGDETAGGPDRTDEKC
ncbi:AtpZ/AtpI family protein [uncultured Desulfovibrio sp.]|uniref:AtpZ/AtpI family protein n=1 Tax=uncultured Desulfovibrio sp. TaxID=167968 RepID=UPI00262A4A67|nr:AtpZ/AtpI family protein [uncultured Desulfovibrio sp.]